jgi:hypothetical protein
LDVGAPAGLHERRFLTLEEGKMISTLTLIGIVVLLGLAVALAALSWPPRKVTLTYVGGEECVRTDKPKAVIYKPKRKNRFKPKKVRWRVHKSQRNQYRWAIEYASDKPGDHEDYLGKVEPIECKGPQSTESRPTSENLPAGTLTWPYRVTVYDCQGAEICPSDPIIIIKD